MTSSPTLPLLCSLSLNLRFLVFSEGEGRTEKEGGFWGLRGEETKDVVGNESGVGNFECFVGKKEGMGAVAKFSMF